MAKRINRIHDYEYISSILHYEIDSGIFYWKKKTKNNIQAWKIAGTKRKSDGYIKITIDKKGYPAHRLAFLLVTGKFPLLQIDHINGITSDNRWDNLREVTNGDNQKNTRIRKDSPLGVAGVYWVSKSQKWVSSIKSCGEQIHIGSFSTLFDAVCARKSAETKFGFHKNHGARR